YTSGNLRMSAADAHRVLALGAGKFQGALGRAGALWAGKPAAEVAALEHFGFHYGVALFITDDLADFVHRFGVTGKDYAPDLRNRRMTLPVVEALRLARGKDLAALWSFFAGKSGTVRQTAEIISRCGAVKATLRTAKRHLA